MTFSNTLKNINLHAHSNYSDGQFSPETLVQQAIEMNMSVLGVTDHYNTEKTLSIAPERLPQYIDELDRLSEVYTGIHLLKGVEINTMDMFLRNGSLPATYLMERLDYILFEYIGNVPRTGIPLYHASLLTKDVPVPKGLAHTDLDMVFRGMHPDECVDKILDAGFFIELNESYRRPGENQPYYTYYEKYLQARNASLLRFSVGSDSHGSITSSSKALDFLDQFKLARNLFIYHQPEKSR